MITFCVLRGTSAWAQEKPGLTFHKNGKFKIAQFTDIHWVHGEPTCAKTTECTPETNMNQRSFSEALKKRLTPKIYEHCEFYVSLMLKFK